MKEAVEKYLSLKASMNLSDHNDYKSSDNGVDKRTAGTGISSSTAEARCAHSLHAACAEPHYANIGPQLPHN
jgi:hypothetical protein